MKVFYTGIYMETTRSGLWLQSMEEDGCEYCCEDMERNYGDAVFSGTCDRSPTLRIYENSYGDFGEVNIDYCPFCGAKILFEETGRKKRIAIKRETTCYKNVPFEENGQTEKAKEGGAEEVAEVPPSSEAEQANNQREE